MEIVGEDALGRAHVQGSVLGNRVVLDAGGIQVADLIGIELGGEDCHFVDETGVEAVERRDATRTAAGRAGTDGDGLAVSAAARGRPETAIVRIGVDQLPVEV